MPVDVKFSDVQKEAIVSLLIEMSNIDCKVASEEMQAMNEICNMLAISREVFMAGKGLDVLCAIDLVKEMDGTQKRLLAKLLLRIIDADNVVDPYEIKLLNLVCRLTGIDLLFTDVDPKS